MNKYKRKRDNEVKVVGKIKKTFIDNLKSVRLKRDFVFRDWEFNCSAVKAGTSSHGKRGTDILFIDENGEEIRVNVGYFGENKNMEYFEYETYA